MKRILILLIALITTASSACAEGTVTTGSVEDRGFVLDNVLHDPERGDIHFNLYVPESYDSSQPVPLYVALPGWEGLYFQGVGADLKWETMPFAARDFDPDMIIASAQLNDWGMTSAHDAVALTEYLMSAYSIDPNHVYLSGYSGGGETGSLVMALRPELYAAYLMMASQWDGDLESLAKARTLVYMIIGEDDSYYGSESLKNAYARLHTLHEAKGLSDPEIDDILVLNVKEADWFAQRGITDQHGGGMAFPEESGLLEWFFSKTKKG